MVQLVAIPPIHIPSFSKWDPQRKDDLFLYANNHSSSRGTANSGNGSSTATTNRDAYRYKLTIIDHPSLTVNRTKPIPSRRTMKSTTGSNQRNQDVAAVVGTATAAVSFTYSNAVFLIPAGRETEYIFSSMSGLRSILQSANTARLIAVAFGREYTTTTTVHTSVSSAFTEIETQRNVTQNNNNNNNMSIEIVQDELRYIVQMIASAIPTETLSTCLIMKPNAPSITFYPFLALNGIGQRNIIDTGITTCSGRYIIEQCAITSDDNDDSGQQQHQQQQDWVRRLYFLDGNPNVIQSEVHISRQRVGNDNTGNESLSAPENEVWIVDKSITAFDYHKSLTAGLLAFLPPLNDQSSAESLRYTGLLIGLGGGSLINFWHCIHGDCDEINNNNINLAITTSATTTTTTTTTTTNNIINNNIIWHVTAIELDATIVQIASKHFGLSLHHPSLSIRIGDGLKIHCTSDDVMTRECDTHATTMNQDVKPVKQSANDSNSTLSFQKGSLDYIVLDVDSKETGAGMSCPPASFVELPYLQTLYTLLHPDHGILAINVAARDVHLFHKTCQAVQCVFPTIFLSKRYRNQETIGEGDKNDEKIGIDIEPEDLNVVIFAMRNCQDSDKVLSSISEMTDHIQKWIFSPNDRAENMEERSILRSNLSECLSDFIPYESSGMDTISSNQIGNHERSKNSTNNAGKRRQSRRGNNKKR